MRKPLLAVLTALTIAGAGASYAQQPPDRGRGPDAREVTPEDRAAFLNARIAALKAGLGLTADQEKSWPPFEQAMRDLAKLHAERREAMRNAAPDGDPIERLRRRADGLTRFGAALKQLADTAQPLYSSLDDAQKHRFTLLARYLRPHMGHHHGMGHRPGMWGRDRGDGRGNPDDDR
ncbi:MAG: Spy/CpxP family protein refolding chaperone [Acetobacteraceae bacterium]|nr:Spy/CpxP family protein refolding chaperone [Acetobacteraceae bacterium]